MHEHGRTRRGLSAGEASAVPIEKTGSFRVRPRRVALAASTHARSMTSPVRVTFPNTGPGDGGSSTSGRRSAATRSAEARRRSHLPRARDRGQLALLDHATCAPAVRALDRPLRAVAIYRRPGAGGRRSDRPSDSRCDPSTAQVQGDCGGFGFRHVDAKCVECFGSGVIPEHWRSRAEAPISLSRGWG